MINETPEDINIISEKTDNQQSNISDMYNLLNKPFFEIDSYTPFVNVSEKEISHFSDQVKGDFVSIINDESIFPTELVEMLERALYAGKLEDINSTYFETLSTLGCDNYNLNLDKIYQLLPNLFENNNSFNNEYEAYQFISGSENCINMFQFINANEEYYVFVYDGGGSNGSVRLELTKFVNNELVVISKFNAQNEGFGKVIKYENFYYYIFLQYNYNLKNYDGVRIHRLGLSPDNENILIQYLPNKFKWQNVFDEYSNLDTNLDDYIESIKDTISSDQYIERGSVTGTSLFYGDETEEKNFVLASEYNQYYSIDFANLGIPIYIEKSNFEPSDYRSTWHLRVKFYLYNLQTNSAMELEKLEIGNSRPLKNELVQMWYKKIDDKVFTFRIYHFSDYNYILNVSLIEGDKISQIRNDIISPERIFILTDGLRFTDM